MIKINFIKFVTCIIVILMFNKSSLASVYQFSFQDTDGGKMDLIKFKGKPMLIVNTASFCGYTYQYENLQNLFEIYKSKNLVIIGIPSNDFGSQEFKNNLEVKTFCKTKFNISFNLSSITLIKGKHGHPFFKWVKKKYGYMSFPKWNFYKYLFDKKGNLSSWFSTITEPNSKRFINEIEKIVQ